MGKLGRSLADGFEEEDAGGNGDVEARHVAGHRDGGDPLTSAGANYGLHPAPRGVVRPAGEWNQARIKVEAQKLAVEQAKVAVSMAKLMAS